MEENEQLVSLINKDLWEVNDGLIIPANTMERNEIREKLAYVIAHLMQENFERLCQAMYRLDVSEQKFHQVITENTPADIPYLIADLVIDREMEKVKTRMMYKRKE